MDAKKVNEFIQSELKKRGLVEVTAVNAAVWLDEASVLKDSASRPGLPLRDRCRKGLINEAYQRDGTHWFIMRKDP